MKSLELKHINIILKEETRQTFSSKKNKQILMTNYTYNKTSIQIQPKQLIELYKICFSQQKVKTAFFDNY